MTTQHSALQCLMDVIRDRKANPPPRSYTTTLFQGGVDRIGCKLMEEAAEVVRAARQDESAESQSHFVHEVADLLYHLFVLMGYRDVVLADVETELARRFGVSGLDEKAARPAGRDGNSL